MKRNKIFHPGKLLIRPLTVLGLLAISMNGLPAEEDGQTSDDELVERVKQEIMQELRESDFLKNEIQAGIQAYIDKQREGQVAAKAEQARQANERAKNVRRVSASRDHIYGDPEATVSIIEYSDFECPYCKSFHATPKQLVNAYEGRVNWVYRHYPLGFHNPGAQKQAEASECAKELGGKSAFWKFADAIYERTTSGGMGFTLDKLTPLAEEIGLDGSAFEECLESNRYAERVTEDLEEGVKSGISGTPGSILLNNKTGDARLVSGAIPFEALEAEMKLLLD